MQNSRLRQVILKRNIYVRLNFSAVCIIENICSKHFLIGFVGETGHDESHLSATYRRKSPNDGCKTAPWTYCTAEGPSITGTEDNSRVVPYCPKLHVVFQCYLNV